MAKERLQKLLVAAGVDSRRRCEELILEGVVRVNKRVVDSLPVFVDPEKDVITVNGRLIRPEHKVYYLLHKPKGVICANSDPQGRRSVIDLIPGKERVFCLGQLEVDSSGLVLVTNDTELANQLSRPRHSLVRQYVVVVEGRVEDQHLDKLKKGVWLSEGKASTSAVKVLHRGTDESMIEITLHQSVNRQVRRMLARVGLDVKSLKRVRIGKLEIRGLGPGHWRPLTTREVEYLKRSSPKENP
jgi:23S rRNA pseudouridine2605 synthase